MSTGSATDFWIGLALTTVNSLCVTLTSGAKSTSFGALGSTAGFSATTGSAGFSATTGSAGFSATTGSAGFSSMTLTSGSFSTTVGADSPFISARACSTVMPRAFALASAERINKCSGISTINYPIKVRRFLHPF